MARRVKTMKGRRKKSINLPVRESTKELGGGGLGLLLVSEVPPR
jgi:hypothetical protein